MRYKITSEQAKWQRQVREHGCIITGSPNVQIHHIRGASYKHNKVWIGQFGVLALHPQYHDPGSNHPLNVTHHRKAFEKEFGPEWQIWLSMVEHFSESGQPVPPIEVIRAVEDLV